jgi:hypothetical protein
MVAEIKSQHDFDQLIECLFNTDGRIVMRAADVIEKITPGDNHFLQKHKKKIFSLHAYAMGKGYK